MKADLIKQLDGLIDDIDELAHVAQSLRRTPTIEELKRVDRMTKWVAESIHRLGYAIRRETVVA